ncbi:PilN domain-containing protein [Parasulfitobacter algicola]|uniref:PilN domain-containing protein n=1 Tax=Parasulfitobacter algicola TaxID=2614809 RepID=A0ABX2IVG1_9RHOB|nr:PilN domain-containing protein [Sulfitobacter algicola]NSX56912.1 PilN domain-containing protein [Sulfitobacter algicola]
MTGQVPSRLWQWFCQELSSVLPGWLKAALKGGAYVVPLYLSQSVTGLEKRRAKYIAPESILTKPIKIQPRPISVDLYLPEHYFLKRDIEAPAAAFKNAEQLVRLDMMRRTPFQPNDVYWTISAVTTKGPKTSTTQWLIKRSDAQQLREHLKTIGIMVRAIRIDNDQTATHIAKFQTQSDTSLQKWVNFGLVGTIAIAVLTMIMVPTFQNQHSLNSIETRITDLRAQAVQLRSNMETLRQAEQDRTALVDTVINKTIFAETLRELTIALPDDVWISDLSFQPERIVVNGTSSSSAAELVLRVANNRLFQNPRLTGPVSRTTSGEERFEMTLDLKGHR